MILHRIRTAMFRAVPDDWRDSVERDLSEEGVRREGAAREIWMAWHALRIGLAMRWRRWLDERGPVDMTAFVDGARFDVRSAWRSLRRAPWYALAMVGVMALAMALATTVFAVVDGVLFKPLPLPRAEQLFTVRPGFRGLAPPPLAPSVSRKDLDNWSATAPGVMFSGFTAQPWGSFGTGVNDDAAGGVRVEPNIFEVLGVRPLIGGFSDADFARNDLFRPVIIRYDVWKGRFHGDTDILERHIEIDRARHAGYRIVGVMPSGFVFPSERADVKFITPDVPTAAAAVDPRARDFAEVIARAPGVSADIVRAEVEAGMARTAETFPPIGPKPRGWSDTGWRREGPYDVADVVPLSKTLGSRSRSLFRAVFLGAVLLVVIGATNVSGLMAARVVDRAAEMASRRALGASSAAIARLVFAEALTLIAAGSAGGLVAAPWLLRLALSLLPDDVVLLKTAAIDSRVAVFVLIAVVGLAVPAAIWPVRRASRVGRPWTSAGGAASGRRRSIGRFVVVSAQIAGGFVLTVGGSLLVGSLLAVYANELPIHTSGIGVVETFVQGAGATMQKSPERTMRLEGALRRLRETPGVDAVAATSAQMLRGGSWGSWFRAPEGARPLPSTDIDVQAVTSAYFSILRPRLVAGRLLSEDELSHDLHRVVVSARLAAAYWPGKSPLGRELIDAGDPLPYTVVGVVSDVRWYSWDKETASIYGPYALLSRAPTWTFVIQSRVAVDRVLTGALRALETADPLISVKRAAPLEELFVNSVRARRFQSWLFGSFAAAGLSIVGVGVFGLLAMATASRVKEVGIRHALGATPFGIVRLLVKEQLAAVAVGLAAGAASAFWAVRSLQTNLYQLTVHDARVWAIAAALILAVAVVGAIVPAVRASRIDPVRALRVE